MLDTYILLLPRLRAQNLQYITVVPNCPKTTLTRGHSRIFIKGVRNTHDTCLIVENDSNCKGFRY